MAGFAIDTQLKKQAETEEDEEAEGKKEQPDADEEQQTRSRAQDDTSAEVDKKLLLLSILEGDLGAFRKRASRYE